MVVSLLVLKLSKHPFKVTASTITCSKSKVEALEQRLNLVVYKMQLVFINRNTSPRHICRWAGNLPTQEKNKNSI